MVDIWIQRLVQEKADLEIKCIALNSKLTKISSPASVNKGDNMYSVMEEQLTAMLEYKRLLQVRIEMVWKRMWDAV